MNALAVAVLFVAVACANASVIGGLGLGLNNAVLAGPSGTVIRSGLGLGLGLPTLAASPIGLIGRAGLIVPAGSGLEGQWIPDINEKLHDDGSYKPQIYGL